MGSSPLTRGKCQPARRVRRPQGLIPAHAGKIGRGTHGRGQRGAHPRSRGENLQRENCSRADQGSSPLTRGKYGGELGVGRGGGLIPAHAGKIRNGASPASHAWAHPRSRGENACGFADGDLCGGSSPLTRGKCRTGLYQGRRLGLIPAHAGKITHDQRAGHRARLIPAHAGKMSAHVRLPPFVGAHPRSRGENASLRSMAAFSSGSSPLTRGKSAYQGLTGLAHGLIPAHAGKIARCPCGHGDAPAHPRSRGENTFGTMENASPRGSSPLTRGKFVLVDQVPQILGLIPAHAGKICSAGTTLVWNQAHPRSRGENRRTTRTSTRRPGSSPLTRGKYTPHGHRWKQCRLIPAHAGKMRVVSSTGRPAAAHPRSRGENYNTEIELIPGYGSSPLTRGK